MLNSNQSRHPLSRVLACFCVVGIFKVLGWPRIGFVCRLGDALPEGRVPSLAFPLIVHGVLTGTW